MQRGRIEKKAHERKEQRVEVCGPFFKFCFIIFSIGLKISEKILTIVPIQLMPNSINTTDTDSILFSLPRPQNTMKQRYIIQYCKKFHHW